VGKVARFCEYRMEYPDRRIDSKHELAFRDIEEATFVANGTVDIDFGDLFGLLE